MAVKLRFVIFYFVVTSSLLSTNHSQRTFQRGCDCEETVDGKCAYTLRIPLNPGGTDTTSGCGNSSHVAGWESKVNSDLELLNRTVNSLHTWSGDEAKQIVSLLNRLESLEHKQRGDNDNDNDTSHSDLVRNISEHESRLVQLERSLKALNESVVSLLPLLSGIFSDLTNKTTTLPMTHLYNSTEPWNVSGSSYPGYSTTGKVLHVTPTGNLSDSNNDTSFLPTTTTTHSTPPHLAANHTPLADNHSNTPFDGLTNVSEETTPHHTGNGSHEEWGVTTGALHQQNVTGIYNNNNTHGFTTPSAIAHNDTDAAGNDRVGSTEEKMTTSLDNNTDVVAKLNATTARNILAETTEGHVTDVTMTTDAQNGWNATNVEMGVPNEDVHSITTPSSNGSSENHQVASQDILIGSSTHVAASNNTPGILPHLTTPKLDDSATPTTVFFAAGGSSGGTQPVTEFIVNRKKRDSVQSIIDGAIKSLTDRVKELERKLQYWNERGRYACAKKGLLLRSDGGIKGVQVGVFNPTGSVKVDSNVSCIELSNYGQPIQVDFPTEQRIYAPMVKVTTPYASSYRLSYLSTEAGQVWSEYVDPEGIVQIFEAAARPSQSQYVELWQPITAKSVRIYSMATTGETGECFSVDFIGCIQ